MLARLLLAAPLAGALLYAGSSSNGPVPALGPFLDPANGVWSVARRAELPHSAQAPVRGLGGDVVVEYDARGVPHIFAAREEDAYRALGYVVARDRLAQLELQTLAASGRLAEIAGVRALELDREVRRLGFPRAAEHKLRMIDTSSLEWRVLRAYADGVNAYIERMSPRDLPLEFHLLGRRPSRWTPIDAMHLHNRMGYTLANIDPEWDRIAAAGAVGAQAAESLFPRDARIVEPIQPNGQRAPRFDFARIAPPGAPDSAHGWIAGAFADRGAHLPRPWLDPESDRPWMASNNWAVSPARSATGHALLAGDPHLELTLPSIWYEAHVVVPGSSDVYGVTIPGLPGIIIGFNRDVAWTFTNAGADVMDFYVETVDDPRAPQRYRLDGRWKPLELRVERYLDQHRRVLQTDTVRYTHRGPMRRTQGRWLSMRWTVLESPAGLAAFATASRARSAREFQNAMGEQYFAPAQNMLAADRHGAIAIRTTGRFPVRPGDGSGLRLRDGSTSASDWRGDLPVSQYPQSFSPAQGYLASANQQPMESRGSSVYFGGSYDPWRALRINRLLREDSSVSIDDMRRFQTDPGSERATLFLAHLRRVAMRGVAGADLGKLREAGQLLGEWDGRYTADNTRAVLFELAMTELALRTWDELENPRAAPGPVRDAVGGHYRIRARVANPATSVLLELLGDSVNAWWDDRATAVVETRDAIIAAALTAALDTARARYGAPSNPGWRWSARRHANVHHLLRLPALSALGIPVQGGPGLLSPSNGPGTHGASWRMVVELGPQLRAWAIYPGGQSGNPASTRYTDRLAAWTAGVLHPLAVPRTVVDASRRSRSTLRLHPAP